jgi:hypothetical protein
MQDTQVLIDLQNRIVRCFANSMEQSWDFLVINFERVDVDGERRENALALAFLKENETWRRISIIAQYDCRMLLVELYELMAKEGAANWSTCMLEIDSSGKYRFSFGYNPPKRLNRVLDDESLLKGYVPKPL